MKTTHLFLCLSVVIGAILGSTACSNSCVDNSPYAARESYRPKRSPQCTTYQDKCSDSDNASPGALAPIYTAPAKIPAKVVTNYDPIIANGFRGTNTPGGDCSTISIDVDTASYTNVRRFIMQEGRLPPPEAVRIEELINFFNYPTACPPTKGDHIIAAHGEQVPCPWNQRTRLLRLSLTGRQLYDNARPAANIVFLIDTSGSMSGSGKLDRIKTGMNHLLNRLRAADRISIVSYAGNTRMVLPSTSGADRHRIGRAIRNLHASGSTNGGAGLSQAYAVAREQFIKGGINRIIMATDGDFNAGITERGKLVDLVRSNARSGVMLTVLGVGSTDLKDGLLEEITNKADGSYAYIDSDQEMRRLFGDNFARSLCEVARNVKIQIFFNPKRIASWRLIGYENQRLAHRAFNDDRHDAGDLHSGQTVTALYEIAPVDNPILASVDPNPFVTDNRPVVPSVAPTTQNSDLLQVRLRFRRPGASTSELQEYTIGDHLCSMEAATADTRWATAVAGFGMLLRQDSQVPHLTWNMVENLAHSAGSGDSYRREFLTLIRRARQLCPQHHGEGLTWNHNVDTRLAPNR